MLQCCFCFMFWFSVTWDLSSPTRDWTCTPCIGRWSFNHWTARDVSQLTFVGSSGGKESICNAGDRVRSLGQEDPLEKRMATYSSILAWRLPWTEESGGLYSPWVYKQSDMTERLTLSLSWEHYIEPKDKHDILSCLHGKVNMIYFPDLQKTKDLIGIITIQTWL